MDIALVPNPERDMDLRTTKRLIGLIHARGGQAYVHTDMATALAGTGVIAVDRLTRTSLLICLGGDGTFLATVSLPHWTPIPTIGVNLGSVGFLPQIAPDALDQAVDALFAQRYTIETRMMLDLDVCDQDGAVMVRRRALNDVVVSRGPSGRIVTIALDIDDERVESVPGDGLIVSTPTGSTAYALSAGGPIVHPSLDVILITPICPHSLHNRSYVASDRATVTLSMRDHPEPVMVSVDGRTAATIVSGQTLTIRRSDERFRLIRLGSDRFYASLSEKIQQRGTLR